MFYLNVIITFYLLLEYTIKTKMSNSTNLRRSARIHSCTSSKSTSDLSLEKENAEHTSEHDIKLFENKKLMEELENIEQLDEKPVLNTDVDGKKMYKIDSTRVKKNAMMEKAMSSQNAATYTINTTDKELCVRITKIKPNVPNVAGESSKKKNNWRSKTTAKSDNDSLETSNESSDEDMISLKDESVAEDKENLEKNNYKSEENVETDLPMTLRRGRSKHYHLKPDEYFTVQSEKSCTSNNTLSKLKSRHISEEELQKLLESSDHISDVHKKKIEEVIKVLETSFIEWIQLMEEGYNVLLYGLGSKRILINNFHEKMIPDEPSLIINGFFPSLTLKDILDSIITDLLGLETVSNMNECFDIIEQRMNEFPDHCIYILFHNIDGGMLRSTKVQDTLSRLASIPNMHFLASIDHINAPMLWDSVMRDRYNFYWVDATTYLPYKAETSYESSLLIQKSGGLALLSLKNVFASLTSNARKVYLILVKYQLENGGSLYTGMAFRDLYRASREQFIVSSDQALRSQLTEFIDHKLVKIKRNIDGESLIIPLDNGLLKQFLDEHEET